MEYRDRNQDPAFLYQRLGWTVRDRDSDARDQGLNGKVTVELTDKAEAAATPKPGKPDA